MALRKTTIVDRVAPVDFAMVTLANDVAPVVPDAVKVTAVAFAVKLVTVASLLTEHVLVPHVVDVV